jgi:kynureninase
VPRADPIVTSVWAQDIYVSAHKIEVRAICDVLVGQNVLSRGSSVLFSGSEKRAVELDRSDPLAHFRSRFHIQPGTIYMDGNSLGLLSVDAEMAVLRVLEQWKTQAIGGYSQPRPDSWYFMGEDLGAMMAPLVGAHSDEVIATGTTTVNLHKLVATFYKPSGAKRKIIATELDFPTDIYALQAQIRLHGGNSDVELVRVPSRDGRTILEDDVIAAMRPDAAQILMPSVLYRSGQLLDIPRLSAAARERGIVIGFDCSHSVGIVPHRLSEAGVDFAMWSSYKYLNAGPGSVAGLYVNRRHHGSLPGLAGWWGNDKQTQFDMAHEFRPAADASAWQISSNPQLSAAPLRASLQMFQEAGIERIREKSLCMTEFLMSLVDSLADRGYVVGNPREAERRGGHVAVEHAEAARICKGLKARGVVPDFRMPNVIRLAPIPLYNTFHEVWRVATHLKEIVDSRQYEQFPVGRDLIA